jgi:polyphenol oxidase
VPAWHDIPDLVHGFCGRRGGVSQGPFAELNLSYRVGDNTAAVDENRRRVAAAVQLPLATMRQVHGNEIVAVDSFSSGPPEADALVTTRSGLALSVLTADCVPIFLVAPRHHAIAAVHAGWRGTLAGIARSALHVLRERFEVPAAETRVALGPAIDQCCYEVDVDIADAVEGRWGALPAAIERRRHGKAHLDLRKINAALLSAAGVPVTQISYVGPCTRCASADYFSHRAAQRNSGGSTGRQLSYAGWRA